MFRTLQKKDLSFICLQIWHATYNLAQHLCYCLLLHYHSLCRPVISFEVLLGKGSLLQAYNIWNQYSCAGYLWDQGA